MAFPVNTSLTLSLPPFAFDADFRGVDGAEMGVGGRECDSTCRCRLDKCA
jgi:hypothetical protein